MSDHWARGGDQDPQRGLVNPDSYGGPVPTHDSNTAADPYAPAETDAPTYPSAPDPYLPPRPYVPAPDEYRSPVAPSYPPPASVHPAPPRWVPDEPVPVERAAASVEVHPAAQVEQAYLTFGPSARLGSIPVKTVERPLRSFESVRDTAIDWLDDKLGHLRAASVRGHIHRYLAEVRQDNFAFTRGANYLALAVSDGVGNAKASHLGSAFASRTIVENEALLGEVVSAKAIGEVSLRDIATLLLSVAADNGVAGAEVSTTLTLAVVLDTPAPSGETSVVLAQIGDSPAFKLSRGEWIELSCPALEATRGALIDNSVEPLPGHHTASVWVETFRPGESLMLVSDGVGDPVKSNAEYARALGALWRHSAPAPADLLKVLDATVKSFDDDRTLVGIRFDHPQT